MFERTRERKGASSCSATEEGIDGLHPSVSKRRHHSLGLAYAGQRRAAQGSALLGARGSKQRALSANSWQREPSCDCAGLLAKEAARRGRGQAVAARDETLVDRRSNVQIDELRSAVVRQRALTSTRPARLATTADMQPDRQCVQRRARARFPPAATCIAGAQLERVSEHFGRTLWESRRGGVGIASRCTEERRMGSACIRALDLQPALEQLGCCQHQQSWLRHITRTWPCRCWLGLLASFREPLSLLLSPPSIRPVPGPIHASLLDRASDLFVGVSRNNLLLCHRRAGKPRLCVGRECDTITLAL
ncbi:hypothetical protein L1887_58665 [Cichorium endivia]|nr:hypothetical protein L1887_58665 [Cichorium endivia]